MGLHTYMYMFMNVYIYMCVNACVYEWMTDFNESNPELKHFGSPKSRSEQKEGSSIAFRELFRGCWKCDHPPTPAHQEKAIDFQRASQVHQT